MAKQYKTEIIRRLRVQCPELAHWSDQRLYEAHKDTLAVAGMRLGLAGSEFAAALRATLPGYNSRS